MKSCKETAIVTTQGQAVIPAKSRERLDRNPGTQAVTQMLMEAHAAENGARLPEGRPSGQGSAFDVRFVKS